MFPACHPGPVNQAQTISNTIKQFRENVPDIAAVVICTREVSVGMLFAQARQVMREYEAAGAEALDPSRD